MDFSPSIETYVDDAADLEEMLNFFRTECRNYLEGRLDIAKDYDSAKGWERYLHDGRHCTTQFPHGHEKTVALVAPSKGPHSGETQLEKLNFVGFFGNICSHHSSELKDEMFRVNVDLQAATTGHPDVLLYGSAEIRAKDGNYYNLVVSRNAKAMQKWNATQLHTDVVRKLSPKYYTTIRIHTGELPEGLDSKEFHLKRSVFLDYRDHQKDPNAPIHREEKYWTE